MREKYFTQIIILAIFATTLIAQNAFAEETSFPVRIKAINPGYTIDGKSNVGEFIELINLSGSSVSLAGLTIGYTNTSGKEVKLIEFPKESWMTGETLLLQFADSLGSANLSYPKTLAQKAGPLKLYYEEEVIDSVCWANVEGCLPSFNSESPTSLVRDLETMDFLHVADYVPTFLLDSYSIENDGDAAPKCQGLVFSELLSYYENTKEEQFIELYNSGDNAINANSCKISYKTKFYQLDGIIFPGDYYLFQSAEIILTKNPVSENQITLIDANGDILDSLVFTNGQKKAVSYAMFGYDDLGNEQWFQTYKPTPGSENEYQKYRTCSDGKIINEETGNCVSQTIVNTELEECPAGSYRNPATNRCKKYEQAAEVKTCQEGYELNPETNRCRKKTINNGAEYALIQEEYTQKDSFIALYAVILVALTGLVYLIFQFRHEIKKMFSKIFRGG